MKITKIEIQKKNKKRYNLYIDDEFHMGIHEDVIVYMGLYVHQEIDESTYNNILLSEVAAKAKAEAINFLSYRMRSVYEVKKKLSSLDYLEDIIDETIDFLKKQGYLNDLEFAKAFIHDKTFVSRHSLKKIKYDIRLKGIHEEVFEEALCDLNIPDIENENIRYFAQKKYQQLLGKKKYNAYEIKQKIYQHLVQKGFNLYEVKDMVHLIIEEESIE